MLRSLYIQNYALIDKLNISFERGFSVITGETGAGKSIILGAIGLLLGQRADVKAIRVGASKCVIEACFDVSNYQMQAFFDENELDYENECILRRELYASGKSRAFINDIPVQLVQMKELGEQLIDIHSQHQNLLLNKEGFQLNVLDLLAHDESLLASYQAVYTQWKETQTELEKLLERVAHDKSDEDYIRFQLEQLEEAHLSVDEQKELEQESEILSHAEEIKAGLYRVDQMLNNDEGGLLDVLKECCNALSGLHDVYPAAEALLARLESSYIELKDIAQEVVSDEEQVEFNPSRLNEVNERLNLIYSLQQKHHVDTVEELITLCNEYASRLSAITSFDEDIEILKKRCEDLYVMVQRRAAELTEARSMAAREIETQMSSRLIPLGMPNVRFVVEMGARKEPGMHGMDTVSFLFSANKNGALQNISSVASGGEIARVMLSVKAMIAGAVKLPTIVFDEIDTGIGGTVANAVGEEMKKLAEREQVIAITHLAQIASRASSHYLVEKEEKNGRTMTRIRCVEGEERVKEIARLLSGETSDLSLEHARMLLKVQC